MSRLVDDFFAFLHVERGMSSHTLMLTGVISVRSLPGGATGSG